MDLLPPELHVRILQYLPGVDKLRFLLLNRYFGQLIERNKKFLAKPKIAVVFGAPFYLEIKEKDCWFGVSIEETTLSFILKENFDVQSLNTHPKGDKMMDGFFHFYDNYPLYILQYFAFFRWLLGKVDLESIEIIPNGNVRPVTAEFVNAMIYRKTKCPKVYLKNGFHLNDPYIENRERFVFFPKFCNLQRKLGEETRLIISDENNSMVARFIDFLGVDFLIKYTKWFDTVMCEFSYDCLIWTMYAICSRWNRGFPEAGNFYMLDQYRLGNNVDNVVITPLKSLKFKVRFIYKYEKQDPDYHNALVDAFFDLNQNLENLTREELEEMLQFYAMDKIPEEIVCKRFPDDEILKFKFAKKGRSVVLSVELG